MTWTCRLQTVGADSDECQKIGARELHKRKSPFEIHLEALVEMIVQMRTMQSSQE